MTAVQMAIVGRRYTHQRRGLLHRGPDHRTWPATGDVPLDRYLLPMALCADAVVRDGELVGDPTEGALVVLAAKGGVDPVLTRERYPRLAEVPFDAAYKFMATFHAMKDDAGKDVIRCYVKGAPDQLLARATSADRRHRQARARRRDPRRLPGRERAPRPRRACASWPPRSATSTPSRSTRPPTCCRWSPT